ncbi:RNA pseudouridine synthase [Pseudoroseomonas rhizosphaerae]|uniref:Pseudouridine synthase n=1 Tax=Teichococcus rhizosphaerae TaxID=1335062 RepID=A0A2C7AIK5_9PROT|nr:RluA family pseudouridine synthase [Pseudoroseomonas rhizosphaerae]PHK96994.1 RNA pseudouridine synthase [Pseudoroseomonas rhizosphaerae]
MTIQHRIVHPADEDSRLDRWFRRHFPQVTQGALQKMLRTGQIRVDGKRAEANTRLSRGQEIRIPPLPEGPAPEPERRDREVSEEDARALEKLVLYRDDSIIALNKPHGLPVQGGPNIRKHLDGMLDALRFGHEERPRLVHRLDRDTSGVILLARDARAARHLAGAFRGRDAQKTYWALVVGQPRYEAGRIDMKLARVGTGQGERTAPAEGKEGVPAVTEFSTVDVARRHATWLELRPLTGRTHQLRVHCTAALECPILGDGKYGGQAAHLEGMSHALHLHARALRVPHPEGGTLEVSAPLPPHMVESFRTLGFEVPRTPQPRRVS